MTAAMNLPVCVRAAAGQDVADAPRTLPVGASATTLTRQGRHVRVGDQVRDGNGAFLIVGFEERLRCPHCGAFGRLAINPWGEGHFVHDDRPQTVLNPSCSALLNHK